MSPDDIDNVVLNLFDLLVFKLGATLDDNDDYAAIYDHLHKALDPFVTRDRNYN
jgi:hypothetical protein